METVITVFHIVICLFLMLVVLLQAGKGGGMGSAFGGGSSSGTVFGGSGAGNFLAKMTVGAAVGFMATSMVLAYLGSNSAADSLQRFSAQQRLAEDQKTKARLDALNDSNTPEAPDTDNMPDTVAPDTDTPDTDTPDTDTPDTAGSPAPTPAPVVPGVAAPAPADPLADPAAP